jgi:adenosylcobinamide amidohydrolase
MLLATLSSGDKLYRYHKSLVLEFAGPRNVISTAPHNGGMQKSLSAVFNNDGTVGAGMASTLKAPTYEGHIAILAEELGFDRAKAAGIGTAAQMENVSIKTLSRGGLTVTAIVTGGVEVNGGRAGDPATWDEFAKGPAQPHGTINTILYIDADLSDGALTRSIITATEAKSSALQELNAPSRYSDGLATGSGTDGILAVSNPLSSTRLTDTGKHSVAGELIGRCCRDATKEALALQSGLTCASQRDARKLLSRFGVSEEGLWRKFENKAQMSRAAFSEVCHSVFTSPGLVVFSELSAHILDECSWGMLTGEEAKPALAALASSFLGLGEEEPDSGEKEDLRAYLENALLFSLKGEGKGTAEAEA